ncbi:hypothetical protein D1BOALGB6SA_5933 [Olavius sp. associated proteobacterium Delta 1]|nr:hypothetical protein D1BOALGB6SA_5933 [Olavius sp. associated proteobacterium Delta 1]
MPEELSIFDFEISAEDSYNLSRLLNQEFQIQNLKTRR